MSETIPQLFPIDDPPSRAKKGPRPTGRKESSGDPEAKRESAYAARERLRAERRRLVDGVARRANQTHREVQARINRATRARSVASATIDQLERGNAILRRELWK